MVYNYSVEAQPGFFEILFGSIGYFIGTYSIFVLAFYVYLAFCLMTIAKRTNQENAWWAWVPILNVLLMLKIAGKPTWWVVLIFIPLVNIVWVVLAVLVWMEIAKKVGQPAWWGILMIVPVANLVAPGYLAFAKK